MAIEYSKRSSQIDYTGGSIREVWNVWDTAGTATILADDVIDLLRATTTGLPARISTNLYERKGYASVFSAANLHETMRLRDIQCQMVPVGKGWHATLTLTFQTRYTFRRDVTTADKCKLPVHRSINPGQRTMPCYREIHSAASSLPTGATIESTADIGGTKLDERGQPSLVTVPQLTITLNYVIDSFLNDPDQYDSWWILYGYTLNDAVFMGYPAYSLLMTEISVSHLEDEYYSLRVTFLYDLLRHYEQVAKADTDGKVKIDTATGQASDVRWKRMNADATTYTAFIPATTWENARLLKGEFGVTP